MRLQNCIIKILITRVVLDWQQKTFFFHVIISTSFLEKSRKVEKMTRKIKNKTQIEIACSLAFP
jgi:hypothetical protein